MTVRSSTPRWLVAAAILLVGCDAMNVPDKNVMCIGGVSYLRIARGGTVMQDSSGKPILCNQDYYLDTGRCGKAFYCPPGHTAPFKEKP